MPSAKRTTHSQRANDFPVHQAAGVAIAPNGQVSINNIVRGPFLSATLGYWIAKPHAGQGLMAEALSLAITHAFSDLALHRVEANIIPRNSPSIALVKRLGFRYEGTATRYLRIAGQWEDHERWGLTAEEWPR